ncbi:hypothetical protein JMJ56_32685 [Belnapia sp. T18]|uniref:Uncharacterized protein n=1 Tax=Belnapia arida TaxID=2804533 RepID=A0ABS1UDE2_9PROT|nr:hypothetical protein [Belnapia arida]MBL6082716.1 hypothetical protein [Belnapia arida]
MAQPLRLIAAGLPQIASYIDMGVSLKLQRVDFGVAEAVMLHFAERDTPCLGIHDSAIIPTAPQKSFRQ